MYIVYWVQASLIQWRATVEPSFFSLCQSAGLLNPGQTVTVGLSFRPAAAGRHSAAVSVSSLAVRGGQETPGIAAPAPSVVHLTGTAVDSKFEEASTMKSKSVSSSGKKPGSGTVSLESSLIVFPTVKVGQTAIAKVGSTHFFIHKIGLLGLKWTYCIFRETVQLVRGYLLKRSRLFNICFFFHDR